MQTVILAGGKGTRISEESHLRPKPMIEIGGKPLLWHIMNIYASQGHNDFIVCAGYKKEVIEAYDFGFNVHVVDTGEETQTGGRLKAIKPLIRDTFFMTYGDGVSDINIRNLRMFHHWHKGIATVTGVHPPGRFGALEIEGLKVKKFTEKPQEGYINGGFFVLEPEILDYIYDDVPFESNPMITLASQGNLYSYLHHGFWQCMDTLRDKNYLEKLCMDGAAPWI